MGQCAPTAPTLKQFRMENAHGAATPMDVHVKLDLAEHRKEREADPAECQAIVGSLMYIALATRPDISFAVSALSRYSSCPLASLFTAAKRATVSHVDSSPPPTFQQRMQQRDHWLHGLRLGKRLRRPQIARRSYVHSKQRCHLMAVRKQDLVASSTTEAEYIACSEAWREARWLRKL